MEAVNASTQGIVYAGTGNGSVPKAMRGAAVQAVKEGIPFVRSSRVNDGG